ncbi:hypothetical protein [Caballeronia sp. M1242]|nr:hypothetical protein [Caballeronia sp. M1242]QSN64010.1 hypothetical protein JYK05_22090 [Caballeronia sp. M1242]
MLLMIDEMGDVRYGDCKKQAGLVVVARQADGGADARFARAWLRRAAA